ncbi:hypothetical protein AWJ20_4160 [Sugiyamaella lignohabitans]|uniref:Snu66p n=1 Tax=Sugiyamaella lignohabitans TaxID=796027 RepID=A0A167C8F6_9ASCO|nr:uncharacterized protein AWJ20_4160 [Sugiyamaella lignohabitans]ANB11354.1 hypothetical protein AWJ20_4160 [Sugiyamaella lignohabitans]
MAGEEEISLEETNKIRKSLGLSLIPILEKAELNSPSEPTKSHENGSGDAEISIEETNRIRLSLGLKPIATSENSANGQAPSDFDDEERQAQQNWLEKTENERKILHQDKIRKRIQEAKERAERRKALEGTSGLAESGDGDDSITGTKSWIEKFREKQRQLQQKRFQTDEDEQDDTSKTAVEANGTAKQRTKSTAKSSKSGTSKKKVSYSSKDLSGLKVGHSLKDIQDLNQDTVLILKDSEVLAEDEENELVSSSLLEKERMEENKKNAKGKSKYAYQDEEDAGENGGTDGADQKFFVLDGSEIVANQSSKDNLEAEDQPMHLQKQAITLDFDKFDVINQTSSDYQESKPVKFKKPKKFKKQDLEKKKRKRFDDTEESEVKPDIKMADVDIPEADDDEELQLSLALNRRRVQAERAKKRKKLSPEELAEQLLADKEEADNDETQSGENSNRLVVSNTTDFLALVRQNSVEPENSKPSPPIKVETPDNTIASMDTPSQTSNEPRVKNEPDDEDVIMDGSSESTPAPVSIKPIEASAIAPEEPSLGGGMADVVRLLQNKGVIKKKTEEDIAREEAQRRQREWARKVEKDRLVNEIRLQRQREEDHKKYDRLTHKDREEIAQHENRLREQEEARAAQERFANYKPDVKIEYHDDRGNLLSTKEAFKHMSRQFHGTNAGKKRVERELQKLEEERQKDAESLFGPSSDSSSSKKTKAGVRLQ